MRKEVKRSLIFWPAFVSATIILMSLLTATNNIYMATISSHVWSAWVRFRGADQLDPRLAETETWRPPMTVDLPSDISPTVEYIANTNANTAPKPELAERRERGSRAMRVPDRIVDVFGTQDVATHHTAEHQYAGKVLQPQRIHSADVNAMSFNLLNGDLLAAERIASKSEIAADRAIGQNTLQVPANFMAEKTASTHYPVLTQLTAAAPPEPEKGGTVDLNNQWIDSQFYEQPAVEVVLPVIDTPSILDSQVATEAIPQPTNEGPSVLPQSIANLAKVIARQEEPAVVQIKVQPQKDKTEKATESSVRRKVHAGPAAWPITEQLDGQLVELAVAPNHSDNSQYVSSKTHNQKAIDWSRRVASELKNLQSLPRLGDSRAAQSLNNLAGQLDQGYRAAEQLSDRQLQIDWLVACHALNRRLAVWQPVYQIVNGNGNTYVSDSQQKVNPTDLQIAISQIRSDLTETGDPEGWGRYLLLDEIETVALGDPIDKRTLLAQRFLSRLRWHGLPEPSRAWLQRESIQSLSALIQPWARNAVDYASLLSQIERHESDAIDLATIDIAGAAQTLRFAEHPKAVEIADAINAYYRNANIRVAISEKMITRMIPEVKPQTVPVRTNILGSRVGGQSNIQTRLNLDLQESKDRWSLLIRTDGNVNTQSVGRTDLTSIATRRDSSFAAATPLQITPMGAQIGQSTIDVRGATRLRGVNTRYDGWPLFGTLVRSVVESRYQESSGLTARIANRRLKTQLGSEIDERLNAKVTKASQMMTKTVMGPLSGLRLDPQVIDMKTTQDRLIARYRLAGEWQIGASTPRPRAPSDSLISLQINQSALNNILERLAPLDSPTTIDTTIQNTRSLFGFPETQLPSDIPRDISIQFAKTRPITFEIEDDKVWVTMRIVELGRAKGAKLKRFIVRAAYVPKIDGLNASLVRDGHLSISGPGMSMRQRFPIRAIFNKVLATSRSIPLTTPKLAESPALQNAVISQLELRDGWLALAISDQQTHRVATQPEPEPATR